MLLTHIWRHWHRPLVLFTAAMAALAVLSAVALIVDDRVLVGSPIWLKPLKFSLSFTAYGLSLGWLLSLLTQGHRAGARAGTVMVVTGLLEMVIIVGQTVRGRRSHFNSETTLDAALFQTMGITIAVFWGAALLVAILLLRERLTDPAAALAVRAGILLAVTGMALGGLMLMPQQTDPAAEANGAHSVGVPDGGHGLPLTGWSITGGDLRIPHFFGMHALQLLPLLLLALDAASPRLPRLRDPRVRLRLMRTAVGAATGLFAVLTWQALRGQPLTGPDALTLTALATLAAGTAVGVGYALAPGAGPQAPSGQAAALPEPHEETRKETTV